EGEQGGAAAGGTGGAPTGAGSPDIGGLKVGTSADGGELSGTAEVFRSPSRLATVLSFQDLPEGSSMVAVWMRDGQEFRRSTQKVGGSGWASFSVYVTEGAFPPGTYTVTISVGEKVLGRKTFKVVK
ncbi:MAG: hypothetical protein H5T86_12275, partial [Armatimonadetes bacterium]|nr:hypothetical protein [Armatimonadota bacterium]